MDAWLDCERVRGEPPTPRRCGTVTISTPLCFLALLTPRVLGLHYGYDVSLTIRGSLPKCQRPSLPKQTVTTRAKQLTELGIEPKTFSARRARLEDRLTVNET